MGPFTNLSVCAAKVSAIKNLLRIYCVLDIMLVLRKFDGFIF